jgi:hypothetical protein
MCLVLMAGNTPIHSDGPGGGYGGGHAGERWQAKEMATAFGGGNRRLRESIILFLVQMKNETPKENQKRIKMKC